jgi:hypothetical protein
MFLEGIDDELEIRYTEVRKAKQGEGGTSEDRFGVLRGISSSRWRGFYFRQTRLDHVSVSASLERCRKEGRKERSMDGPILALHCIDCSTQLGGQRRYVSGLG